MGRTNIVIDDALVEGAMRLTGARTSARSSKSRFAVSLRRAKSTGRSVSFGANSPGRAMSTPGDRRAALVNDPALTPG